MKRHLILLAAALSCGLYSFAQVSFGIKAGFSSATTNFEISAAPVKVDTKTRPAFHAGVIADLKLANNFSLQPGLFYSSKGSKKEGFVPGLADGAVPFTTVYRVNYLELPLNLLYKGKVGKGRIFGGFGPYLAYGISGKTSSTFGVDGEKTDGDVKFSNNPPLPRSETYVKPFDAGANFIAGYELDMGLLFSANFSLGLVNTTPIEYQKEKNRYFGISVGYLLRRK